MRLHTESLPQRADDGHEWTLQAVLPEHPRATVQWHSALGVASRHYLPFAHELAGHGIAVYLHEWRGIGSSNLRAGRDSSWGYREVLELDMRTSADASARRWPDLPRIIGGHSLGGQLSSCYLALNADAAGTLWLVGSGAPYWRAFPFPARLWLPLAYRYLAWQTRRNGMLPGRRINFGGNEAHGLVMDWYQSAMSGRYAAAGIDVDLDRAMARVSGRLHGIVLRDDWMAPEASTRFLMEKLQAVERHLDILDSHTLGTKAGHFEWMKTPAAVAQRLIARLAL